MRRVAVSRSLGIFLLVGSLSVHEGAVSPTCAADNDLTQTIIGTVQDQDLRRVDQAIVQVRDQEGTMVAQGVTNQGSGVGHLFDQCR
jgi:hypothetical protein